MLMFQPQIMGFLIDFVEVKYFVDNCEAQGEGYEVCETDQIYYIWHGYLYAVLLFGESHLFEITFDGQLMIQCFPVIQSAASGCSKVL